MYQRSTVNPVSTVNVPFVMIKQKMKCANASSPTIVAYISTFHGSLFPASMFKTCMGTDTLASLLSLFNCHQPIFDEHVFFGFPTPTISAFGTNLSTLPWPRNGRMDIANMVSIAKSIHVSTIHAPGLVCTVLTGTFQEFPVRDGKVATLAVMGAFLNLG